MMIIYCAGAVRGDTTYQKYLKKIVKFVDSLNHSCLSEFNQKIASSVPLTDKRIFKRDMKWIEKSDAMIAEVSGPSLGVGFEIAVALFEKRIPVLVVANEKTKKVSAMISGNNSKLLSFKEYFDTEQLQNIITDFLENIGNKQ